MKHSIVSWDCTYRNFFHLIDGLLAQDYSRDEFELIYVEQRSREFADAYNHAVGLKSLYDRYEEVKDQMNITVLYLDEDASTEPYHLGKSNNAGIAAAKGDIISVMDGDQLLPSDFLTRLQHHHAQNPSQVFNIYRKMGAYPVGVDSYANWTQARPTYETALATCPERYITLPTEPKNFGPMISAPAELWRQAGGYDTHSMWSTALSKLGGDANERLSIAAGKPSQLIQDMFVVHPWHPIGVGAMRKSGVAEKYFGLQDQLTKWSQQHNSPAVEARQELTQQLFDDNQEFVRELIHSDIEEEMKDVIPTDLLEKKRSTKRRHMKEAPIYWLRSLFS